MTGNLGYSTPCCLLEAFDFFPKAQEWILFHNPVATYKDALIFGLRWFWAAMTRSEYIHPKSKRPACQSQQALMRMPLSRHLHGKSSRSQQHSMIDT